jgi:hypothetical protein
VWAGLERGPPHLAATSSSRSFLSDPRHSPGGLSGLTSTCQASPSNHTDVNPTTIIVVQLPSVVASRPCVAF